jgi:hypothetical protein
MRVTSPTLRRDLLDAVPRFIEIEQGTRALRLFERMNIGDRDRFASSGSATPKRSDDQGREDALGTDAVSQLLQGTILEDAALLNG